MPTYEYMCKKCHNSFEIQQRITDGPLKKCPACHGPLIRLINGGKGLIFKGHGFYVTDYKKADKPHIETKNNK